MQTEPSEYQEQLVRGLAHRMNNILTLFHGYVGLLLDNKKLDAESRDGLAKMKRNARAATDLIDRTHALVRSSSGHTRDIDVLELVLALRPAFDALRGPDTQISIEIPYDLPHLRADGTRIKTALTELVRNALEATAEGGDVEISARVAPAPAGHDDDTTTWVAIEITDEGPGIPEECGRRIFQPFFTTKRMQNAAGLGLSIALAFAQQHGGTICYHRRAHRSVFELILPCLPAGPAE